MHLVHSVSTDPTQAAATPAPFITRRHTPASPPIERPARQCTNQRTADLETGQRLGYTEGWYWGFGCGACLGSVLTALLILARTTGLA